MNRKSYSQPAHSHSNYKRINMIKPIGSDTLNPLFVSDDSQREALIAHLKAQNILAVFHYQPLHLSKMGTRFGGKQGDCPVCEDVTDRVLRLPFYNGMTKADQECVVSAIRSF